ncbi:hypothetical protein SAMN04488093_102574 [Tropicibacter naphthalenivorans]|uniref:Uncharacterized protein n=2 Tax=Tropicibacter naphthalenivorans TaxID=441103 RepID=A0A0P1G4M7_9RHOB|nr:hypothetical protein TRN7648_01044 [Tropicibacter naphthalenivorans]SMC64353.1 hypothetical protein SAMN04488093_102574 [Tropicibacter naphthalenivorans]
MGLPVALMAAVWFLAYSSLKEAGGHDGDRARMMTLATRLHRPYKATLEAVLRWLERILMPDTVTNTPMPDKGWFDRLIWRMEPLAQDEAAALALRDKPWSWPVLNFALRVALAYPIVISGHQWMLSGSATGLGGFELFPEGVGWLWRVALIGLIDIGFLAGILASAFPDGAWKSRLKGLQVGALVLALAFSVVSAVALILAGALVFAVGGPLALALLLAGPLVLAVAGPLAFAGALAVAGAVAGAVALGVRKGHGTVSYLLYLSWIFGVGLVAAYFGRDTGPLMWSIALVLLPSINALFDWLSYGFTIWLLQMGRRKRGVWPFLAGIADIAMAALIFAALATALVVTFQQINIWRGEVLIDVREILDDPGAHLWVVAMVASTLLPTMVHLGLAAFSVITWVPVGVWQGLVARLNSDRSAVLTHLSAASLATILTGLYALPVVGFGAVAVLLWRHSAWVLDGYLWWLREVLMWMGGPGTGLWS